MLRCRDCGAEVSEWAGRCPRCRGSLDGALPLAEPPPEPAVEVLPEPTPEPLPPDSSGWSQRRLVGVGAAITVAVVIVAVLAWRTGTHRPAPAVALPTASPSPSASALQVPLAFRRYTLVYGPTSYARDFRVIPLDGAPGRDLSAFMPSQMLQVGSTLAFVATGTAYSLSSPFREAPQAVAPADYLFPADSPATVGVARGLGPSPVTIEVVDAFGNSTGAVRIPDGYEPVAYLRIGYLLRQPSGGLLRTWRGQFLRTIGKAVQVLAVSGNTVAWTSSDGCDPQAFECPLHVTDAATGEDHVVPPPPGHAGFVINGAFSPDQRSLAAYVMASATSRGLQEQLAIINLGTMQAILIPKAIVHPYDAMLTLATWTPDGAQVIFCGGSGPTFAYQPGGAEVTPLEVPCSYSLMVFL